MAEIIWLSGLSTLRVPDEGYSVSVSCTLKLDIYAFILILSSTCPVIKAESFDK
jgi:hypothetical protein